MERLRTDIYPSEEEFVRLARRGNVIPVYRQISADFETPLSVYLKLEDRGPAYLLESVEGGERLGRYSFIGASFGMILEARGRQMCRKTGRSIHTWVTLSDPIAELEQIGRGWHSVALPGLPRFWGGWVGYMGYDTVRFLEPIGEEKPDVLQVPDSVWLLSDALVVFDHVERTMKVVACAILPEGSSSTLTHRARSAYRDAVQRVEGMLRRLRAPLWYAPPKGFRQIGRIEERSNMTRQAFLKAVRQAKQRIAKGEAIQIVLSQRFTVPIGCAPFEIYRALRSINPSPYMFYLHLGAFTLVGSSPEILVRCEGDCVETRPIAGTRRRGKNPASDLAIEQGLIRNPKERAEHLMLADLGRNDLGRVCEYGSVKVTSFMQVERYSHVMHLVSHVEGRLRKGKNAFDVLRAVFPAGTVVGAPKVRAMQIINELEPDARGPYAGAVGYIGFNGNLDTCIAIRMVLIKGGEAMVQTGAGIVADSSPKREYQETRNKAAGMLEAIRMAQRGLP